MSPVQEQSQDDFLILGNDKQAVEHSARKKVSYWTDVWRRFRQNRLSVIALILLLLILALTVFGPMLSSYSFEEIDAASKNMHPSAKHWFGTDSLGRDLFVRVCYGGRVSMIIGIVGAIVSTVIGIAYGSISAFFGGRVDMVMMRIVEIISSVPYLIVVILISVVIDDRSLTTMLVALTITGWCSTARLIRGQILQLREQEYVMAARALGVGNWSIIVRHLIPNTLGLIIVGITFDIPGYIFSESFLSFIGIGIKSPETSWGALAAIGQANFRFYGYQLWFPAAMIALTMLAFTLFGDGLRDALDPKLRR